MTSTPLTRRTVIAAGAAAALPLGLQRPAAASAPQWRDVTASVAAGLTSLSGLTFPGPRDGWALAGRPAWEYPALLHWNGRKWGAPLPLPGSWGGSALIFAASGRREIWAMSQGRKGVALYWNGSAWRDLTLPVTVPSTAARVAQFPQELYPESLSAGRDGTAWAVLADSIHNKTLVMRWAGDAWVPADVPLPPFAYVSGVAVRSRRDIWLFGESPKAEVGVSPFTLHWNGRAWADVKIPEPPVGELSHQRVRSVLPVSGSLAWAFHSSAAMERNETLLRWTGGAGWEQFHIPIPGDESLYRPHLADDGQGGLWIPQEAVGSSKYLHFRAGELSTVRGPKRAADAKVIVSSIARIPGTRTVLATGGVTPPNPGGDPGRLFVERFR